MNASGFMYADWIGVYTCTIYAGIKKSFTIISEVLKQLLSRQIKPFSMYTGIKILQNNFRGNYFQGR